MGGKSAGINEGARKEVHAVFDVRCCACWRYMRKHGQVSERVEREGKW